MLNVLGVRKLPLFIQAEAAECGLACLAMVSSYHGGHCDVSTLRRRFGSSARGANLQTLISQADSLKLASRALRVELTELSQLSLPAVLHWNFNHFVVLKRVSRRFAVVHDPAVGERKYSLQELGNRFTGIVLELTPGVSFESTPRLKQLRVWDFWNEGKGLIPSLVQIFVLSLLIQIIALATPLYMQIVVDDVLNVNDRDLLWLLAFGFAGLTVFSVVMTYVRGLAGVFLTSQLRFNMGNSVHYHLIRLPLEFFSKRHMGDILSRFESLTPVQNFISSSTVAIMIDGLLAITTLTMIFWYSRTLGFIVLAFSSAYGIFRNLQFGSLKSRNLESISANARLETYFIESLRSIQSIKLAGKEVSRETTWRNRYTESIGHMARVGRLTVSYEAVNSLLIGTELILFVYLGAIQVMEGVLTVGMLYALLAYRSNFSKSIYSLIDQMFEFRMIGLHLDRLSDITNTDQEKGLQSAGSFTFSIRRKIELKDVSFSYDLESAPVLENLTLDFPADGFTAIIGPSGIGKSTLLKILLGLHTPTKGKLLADEMPMEAGVIHSYRKSIAAVTQDDSLLSGSLLENITFFDFAPEMDKVIAAAENAEIHGDIARLPMQYESLIGDMGTALSQGQQQRVLIARALYSDPELLFLDEGTAFLDAETEEKIFANVKKLGTGCVFVTHNTVLLRHADQVIYWDGDGKILVSTAPDLLIGR